MAIKLKPLDCESDFGTRKATLRERLVWKLADHRWLPQSVRRRLRKRFARTVNGPFDVTFKEMNFRLYPAENYCDRVLFGRNELPEREEHEALLPYLSPGMVFVDIGANVGSYSTFVGRACAGDLTLLAFEPHPRTFQKLIFNLNCNRLPVENALNYGVGPETDRLSLWSDGGSNIGHTSMLKQGTSQAKVSVDVSVRTLADVCNEREIERIDVLKIDVEGFEDRALYGFLKDTDTSLLPGTILIETAHQHLWENDLMGLLQRLDYKPVFRTDENVLLCRQGQT